MFRISLLLPLTLLLAACQLGGGPKPAQPATAGDISPAAQNEFAAATAAMKAQRWSEAEALLQQVAHKQPNASGAYLNLALIAAQANRTDVAEAQFKKAIEINPDNLSARDQYGIWLRTQGRFRDAENVYLQTLQRRADRADTHLNLGILYDLYFGRSAQALTHYERYLALKGDDGNADVGKVKSWVADLQRRNKAGG